MDYYTTKNKIVFPLMPDVTPTDSIDLFSDDYITISAYMLFKERQAIHIEFHRIKKLNIVSQGPSFVRLGNSCGEGIVFWSKELSVHSTDMNTVIVFENPKFKTDLS